MPHEDGDAYAGVVATVSLGSGIVLDLYEKAVDLPLSRSSTYPAPGKDYSASGFDYASENGQAEVKWRIYQEPRSLLVTCGDAYKCLLHGISETIFDDQFRPPEETKISNVQCSVNGNNELMSNNNGIGIANWDLLGNKNLFQSTSRVGRSTRVSLTYRDVLKVSKNIFG